MLGQDPTSTLLHQETFLRTLFEESSIGMNLCRMDGQWLGSNPAFLAIIGYTREEADGGLSYWQLTPRRYDADEAVQLRALQSTGRYGPYEKEFIRKDGSLVPVRLNGYLVNQGGEQLIWSFIEDISVDRALAQERLKAIQSTKLAALGELASSIAHEINNPLSIIAGHSFLLETAEAGDTQLVHEAAREIQRAVERAAAITRSLQRMSRDTTAVGPEPVSVQGVVLEACTLTNPRVRSAGLTTDLHLSTAARVSGNAVQLSQVLINLINNAVDAVRDQAQSRYVGVLASDVTTPEHPGGAVELCVEDSGPGVPEELRHRLFDSFFTTKPIGLGTGLGLSISQQLARSMGGTLRYERVAGRTRFVLRLPTLP